FPGLSRFQSAGGTSGGARTGHPRTASPVRRDLGSASLPAGAGTQIERFTGLALDPDQHFVVTCGSTEAMMVAMMTACNPGDRVIVFSPFYENYAADAILSGATPIFVPLRPPDFSFDPEELAAAFEHGAKALILCNPSNPTGKVFSREE